MGVFEMTLRLYTNNKTKTIDEQILAPVWFGRSAAFVGKIPHSSQINTSLKGAKLENQIHLVYHNYAFNVKEGDCVKIMADLILLCLFFCSLF